jgi:hypothetical protein
MNLIEAHSNRCANVVEKDFIHAQIAFALPLRQVMVFSFNRAVSWGCLVKMKRQRERLRCYNYDRKIYGVD